MTRDDILAFYREGIGTPILRSSDGLESAIGRPQHSVLGQDAYLTLDLKAAALMQSLAENQPFLDGNKRIAWIAAKTFLQINGATIEASRDEGVMLFNQIAAGISVEEIARWIRLHTQPHSRFPIQQQ